MHWTDRRERFRALLEGDECIHPGSVYDAISARIAEDLGFEVGMFAGSIGSLSVLGAPDLIVLTLTEFAQQAYRICSAGNLALLVDADHGYGNALNVRRTVEELESAGVAAMTIEDTVLPTPYGQTGGPELISLEEGVGKMRAALEGRQDPSLVIAGRTQCRRDHRPGRRDCAGQGLSGGRRRCDVLRRHQEPGGTRKKSVMRWTFRSCWEVSGRSCRIRQCSAGWASASASRDICRSWPASRPSTTR